VLNGVKVGEHHYVRLFPVWFEFRGNHGTVLTQTKAISAAAHLRGSLELASLAQQQLEWVVGRNPFVQSTMWGEGYDYAPQYSAMSGDIVGSLPVGIQSHRNGDQPYWPTENCHNWKEVWVHPVARWIWLMRDLAGPGYLSGHVEGSRNPIDVRDKLTGKTTRIDSEPRTGSFHTAMPEGEYEVSNGATRRGVVLLPGGSYDLDFRGGRQCEFRLAQQTGNDGSVALKVTVEGIGRHSLTVLADNLSLEQLVRQVDLSGKPQTITIKGKMGKLDAPWVAVVVADDDLTQRKEAAGAIPRQ
jgi:hypothetical protein